MKAKSNKLGVCPFCNNETLDYGAVNLAGDCCYFPWECLTCKRHGEEWYSMDFVGHNIFDDEHNYIEIPYPFSKGE